MAPAAVRFHPAAAQEVESTYEWYAARNPPAAHGFREELRQAIDAVAASPRTWPRYGNRARRYVFPRYPFSLVYILRGDGIEITLREIERIRRHRRQLTKGRVVPVATFGGAA